MPTFPRCASSFALVLALVASRGAGAASATSGEAHPGQRAFAIEVARQAARPGLDAAAIEAVLAQARYQQSIIDAISRPAEKTKPWRDYRPIFLTPQRAEQGLVFWRENAALLDRVSAEFGVPPEIIVAIIGVETSYGRITGRYRVLDALVTLAFYYPPRAEFFRKEGIEAILAFLLVVVWWAWIYTTWMANWFDPDSPAVRTVLTGVMLGSLLMIGLLAGENRGKRMVRV